jgi:hypothetical protein
MTSFFPESSNAQARDLSASSLASFHGWNLEAAKARLSEVVRLARIANFSDRKTTTSRLRLFSLAQQAGEKSRFNFP